jgi:hypothetical protein
VSKLHTPTLQALAFARATRPSTLTAITVRTTPAEADRLMREWVDRDVPVPLTVLNSPFREITRPVLDYISQLRQDHPRDVISVFIPEYVVTHWWQHFLHNQSALRLKARLLFQPRVMVTSVPWQLGNGEGNGLGNGQATALGNGRGDGQGYGQGNGQGQEAEPMTTTGPVAR